jgi:hypothetical protein
MWYDYWKETMTMKRFAPLLLLLTLPACSSRTMAPQDSVPNATLKRAAPCALGPLTSCTEEFYNKGSRQVTELTVSFHTSCASDVNVKVYYVFPPIEVSPGHFIPSGRSTPIGSADAIVIPESDFPNSILRRAVVRFVVPKIGYSTYDSWNPMFRVEVRACGTFLGTFITVDDGTPD